MRTLILKIAPIPQVALHGHVSPHGPWWPLGGPHRSGCCALALDPGKERQRFFATCNQPLHRSSDSIGKIADRRTRLCFDSRIPGFIEPRVEVIGKIADQNP